MVTRIGLDLGYANITISDASLEVYREPSIALIDKNTRRILSVGRAAVAENPGDNGVLVRPFKNGLLYSADFTSEIIKAALDPLKSTDKLRCVVGIPSDFNSKQQKELASMFLEEGIDGCLLVNRAVAALMGAGYKPTMSVVSVNIGACFTEIAVLYRGSVIYSKTVEIGGEDFDEAVQSYILKQGDLNISLLDARAIKEEIGSVWQGYEADPITISGMLALTGNKIRMTVGTSDILGVFEEPLHRLLLAIADGVKKIPTDYVEEIFKNGIVLSGGGAMLKGLDKMTENVFNIGTTLAMRPMDCVACGLSVANSFIPLKVKGNGKDVTDQLAKYYESGLKK
jgi:rod shape-determining protein MreB